MNFQEFPYISCFQRNCTKVQIFFKLSIEKIIYIYRFTIKSYEKTTIYKEYSQKICTMYNFVFLVVKINSKNLLTIGSR